MKLFAALFVAVAAFNAMAQQVPGAVAQPPASGQPPVVPAGAAAMSNAEIAALLRAQTAAIKALSNKLDAIDERLGKIERGAH